MDHQLVNDIISTSVGGAAGGAVAGLVLYGVQQLHVVIRDKLDGSRIFKWLTAQSSAHPGEWNFRGTRTIASHNNLTQDRVRYLCSSHQKIFLSTGDEDDLWTIHKEILSR